MPRLAAPRASLALALALASSACGAGPYGHSRTYEPLEPEAVAATGAEDFDPVMVRRQPELWQKKKVNLFGVVLGREDLAGGKARVTLSVRTLAARNLCENASDDSCRTTVSDQEYGKVRVTLTFADGADEIGQHSVGQGSLLRVIGKLTPASDAADAGRSFDATYYRHWPRGFYVTQAAAGALRR